MEIVIRMETGAEADAIHRINAAAFPTEAESNLVDELRKNGALTLSLVAEVNGELVGHIAFSPVTVDADGQRAAGVGLAPMAVVPAHQRRGIGGRLIDEGLRHLRAAGHRFCVVLGHPDYYPRHGFVRASLHGIRWEHPAPDEAFLVQALTAKGLDGITGIVRYRPELDGI